MIGVKKIILNKVSPFAIEASKSKREEQKVRLSIQHSALAAIPIGLNERHGTRESGERKMLCSLVEKNSFILVHGIKEEEKAEEGKK